MSANPVARPQSRRAFIGALALLPVGTGAASTEPAAPDPIFALLEEEARTWKAFNDAIERLCEAERVFRASGWKRKPRVQVAVMVDLVSGPNLDPIPADKLVKQPVYVYSQEEIDENCDRYPRFRDATPEQVEARRRRMHAEFEADAKAIAQAPETVFYEQAEADEDRLSQENLDANEALLGVHPTTIAGFLALLDRIRDREAGCANDLGTTLEHICTSAHALLSGRAA